MSLEGILKKFAQRLPEGIHADLRRAWEIQGELTRSAIVLRRPRRGRRVVFRDFEIADLELFVWRGPGAGEVLVEVHYSAVSPGTESSVLMGLPNAVRSWPFYPGYSGSGRVISVGRGVRHLKAGDMVAGQMRHGSYAVVQTENVVKYQQAKYSEPMALIELACIVQQGLRKARILPGEHVAIVGAGLLGQLSTLYADYLGAGQISLVARSVRNKELSAGALPRHDFLATEGGDASAVGRLEADVVVEAAGNASALMTSIEAVRRGGRIVNLGSPRDSIAASSLLGGLAEKGATLLGAHISTLPEADRTDGAWTLSDERKLFSKLVNDRIFQMPGHKTVPARDSQAVNLLYESIVRRTGGSATLIFSWL